MGAEGAICRTPFDPLPVQDWPWDFCAVLNYRRMIDAVEREIGYSTEFPPPSERTKRSVQGVRMWREWVKVQQTLRRQQKDDKHKQDWERMHVPGYNVVFDFMSKTGIMYADIITGELIEPSQLRIFRPKNNRQTKNSSSSGG